MTRERIKDFKEIVLPFFTNYLLKRNYENLGKSDAEEFEKDFSEIIELADKALEQQPCEDCISRKALLEEIENGIKAGNYEEGYEEYPHINDMDDIIECIKYADSVQPKPKTDVLDKIRAEIEALEEGITSYQNDRPWIFKDEVLQIIDKYKAESEDKE